jgi:hypothetical protein
LPFVLDVLFCPCLSSFVLFNVFVLVLCHYTAQQR